MEFWIEEWTIRLVERNAVQHVVVAINCCLIAT